MALATAFAIATAGPAVATSPIPRFHGILHYRLFHFIHSFLFLLLGADPQGAGRTTFDTLRISLT